MKSRHTRSHFRFLPWNNNESYLPAQIAVSDCSSDNRLGKHSQPKNAKNQKPNTTATIKAIRGPDAATHSRAVHSPCATQYFLATSLFVAGLRRRGHIALLIFGDNSPRIGCMRLQHKDFRPMQSFRSLAHRKRIGRNRARRRYPRALQ